MGQREELKLMINKNAQLNIMFKPAREALPYSRFYDMFYVWHYFITVFYVRQ